MLVQTWPWSWPLVKHNTSLINLPSMLMGTDFHWGREYRVLFRWDAQQGCISQLPLQLGVKVVLWWSSGQWCWEKHTPGDRKTFLFTVSPLPSSPHLRAENPGAPREGQVLSGMGCRSWSLQEGDPLSSSPLSPLRETVECKLSYVKPPRFGGWFEPPLTNTHFVVFLRGCRHLMQW